MGHSVFFWRKEGLWDEGKPALSGAFLARWQHTTIDLLTSHKIFDFLVCITAVSLAA